jgi:sporulation protein YlmC with PRC-barrel domain
MEGYPRAFALVFASLLMTVAATAQPATSNNGKTPAASAKTSEPGGTGTTVTATPKPAASKYLTQNGGFRVASLIGAAIYNDQNQQIGTISDVLLDKQGKATKMVLSVGGFLGVGSRLVAVPFSQVDIGRDKVTVPGATKVSLENLPVYSDGASG